MSVGKATVQVTTQHLAPALKTGTAHVMSTAVMAALMEEAACAAVPPGTYKPGQTSVGVHLDLLHKKPSALGATVQAVAHLKNVTQKKLDFEIEVFDETGLVGTAKHQRAFVMTDPFEEKCTTNFFKAMQTKANKK